MHDHKLLGCINWVMFYACSWFLVAAGGLLGLFVPRWNPFHVDVFAGEIFKAPLVPAVMASALNQYRSMKSEEFGFGVFALLFRREIYGIPKFNRFFLSIVFLGASVRALSVVVDGRPDFAYIFFMIMELMTGLVVLAYSRTTLKRS